ncbi:MAG: hypothetical protein Alis3KO_41460 [Aliiglaciecola sp.]
MDEFTLALVIILMTGALPCMFIGYLIAVKQKRGLIAGWDESKISNPKAYAQLIGYGVFILGILLGVVAIFWHQGLVSEIGLAIGLFLVSLVPIPFLVLANKKYKSHVS